MRRQTPNLALSYPGSGRAKARPGRFPAPPLIRTYPDAQRAHIGTKDALNNEVKIAFGQGDLSWKPGHHRSAYGAICCHRFKPKNMTDDIFLAEILGHKLLPGSAALSVGQSYKDFSINE